MQAISGLWRWRRNPLCRPTDRREAWLALCAVLLVAVGTPLACWTGRTTALDVLRETIREQHKERHFAWATVEQLIPHTPDVSDVSASASPAPYDGQYRVVVFWKGPDGVSRTGEAGLEHALRPGDRFRVWTDGRGHFAEPPMSDGTASLHALLAGLVAGAAAGALIEGGRRLAVSRLLRVRYARWDEEWRRIGPDWGRTGTNN